MTSEHRMSARRYALAALAVAALWLGTGSPASAADAWTPQVTIPDAKGKLHEGKLEQFVLKLKGHATVAPTDKIELNGVERKTSDLRGIRLIWTAGTEKVAEALAVSFEFADGSVVEPRIEKEGAAPVTSLSFTFAEEGRDRLSWSFPLSQPVRGLFTRITRIDVVVKAKGDPDKGDPGKGDPGKGDPGKGDPGKGDPGPTGELLIAAYEDANGNGVRDRGEVALSDWEFTVIGPGGDSSKSRTQRDGTILTKLPIGRYTVVETGLEAWKATTPAKQEVLVGRGKQASVEFGNRKGDGGGGGPAGATGKLFILAFEDKNGNGTRDRGEAALSDWEVTVTDGDGKSSKLVTDGDGSASGMFPVGDYTVVETGREGWKPTTPAKQSLNISADAKQKADVQFGNRKGEKGDTLPPKVVVDPARCDCRLGALPITHAIVLRWSLCAAAISIVDGEPRLYRADHGAGNWQRVLPSSGVPGVLLESSLASLPVSASDQELFRDIVRHYKSPADYVETPLPAGKTAAQAAEEIRDLAYVVLVTRFGLTLNIMEAMGLGIVDTNVSIGSHYDYVLTVWTPQVEKLCCRVDNVEPLSPPDAPAPTAPGAEVLRTRMPDRPGARRPDSTVTPIGVTWTSPIPVVNPPSPPYADGAFAVVAYIVERKDGPNGAWTKLGDGPILEVKRTDTQIALTGNPPTSPAAYRFLDIATEDHHTYSYRIRSLDLIGRTSVPSAVVSATAYVIPAPIPWKTFTASWNVSHASVDVVLTLKTPLPSNRQLWVERTCPTATDPEAVTRLNPGAAWTGAGPFSFADAGVAERTKYVYKIVIDGPAAGTTIDMNLRATMVVPDLTPPPPPPPLQFVLRPGTPLTDAVTKALSDQTLLDQNDKQKWEDAMLKVRGQIAAELAKLQPKTESSTESVTLEGACQRIEVSLDELEGAVPDFSGEKLPFPPRAELVYANGEHVQGLLEELDLDGPSLSCHLLPNRALIVCDGRSIPWDEVNSISLLWKVLQPNPKDRPLRTALPSITDTNGEVAFPKLQVGAEKVAAPLKKMHFKLATPGGSPASVTWDFDADKQVAGAREIRSVRLLDTPWRMGTPGETFSYLWSDPERLHPPEGEVTKVEIDPTAAPGRKAKVTGSPFPGPLAASSWTVRGHLVSMGVVTAGSKAGAQPVSYPLNANSPGQHVTIGSKVYSLDDLIRVEIVWSSSGKDPKPARVTLTFHHAAELRAEDLPAWPDADVKARALTLIEEKRLAPYMPDVLKSREGVILYWSYPPPANPSVLAGFNVYRATGDAPTVFTLINPEPIPFPVVTAALASPPSGWPPAIAGTGSLCWFEDHLFGGVGSQYFYRVTAVDDTGLESPPNPPTGLLVSVPDRDGPPPPVLVSVKKQHSNAGAVEVRIEWRAPQHPYDVVVYRKEAGSNDPAMAIHTAATQTNPDTSFVDPGPFLPLKSYEYFLRGVSGVTPGKPSGTRTVQFQAEDVPPVISTPLTAVAAAGQVTLTWGAPTLPTGVTVKHYVLERRESGSTVFRLRAGSLTSTTFLDDRVISGKTYDYRVVLIDSNDVQWLSAYAPFSISVP